MAIPIYDCAFPERLAGCEIEDVKAIFLGLGSRARKESTVAHEIAHRNMPADIPAEFEEAYCNRVAAALMIPRAPFISAGDRYDWEVEDLAQCFSPVSYEMVAMRIVETAPADQGFVAARWCGMTMRWRYGCNENMYTTAERDAVFAVHGGDRISVSYGAYTATAWLLPRSAQEQWRILSLLRRSTAP
jgi:hypothetical protein